jgi:hypothetical protein
MDIATVIERLDNLKQENTKEHNAICDRLDYTNGDVKTLKLWKAEVGGFLKGLKILYILVGSVIGLIIPLLIKYL